MISARHIRVVSGWVVALGVAPLLVQGIASQARAAQRSVQPQLVSDASAELSQAADAPGTRLSVIPDPLAIPPRSPVRP